MRILQKVKETFGLPVLTDFHEASQAMKLATVVDVLQVPAFLCRQTDMIAAGAEACAKYGRILKIKKDNFYHRKKLKTSLIKRQRFFQRVRSF